jgi:hypothetical protein
MARRADRSELYREDAVILPPKHELFAASVAGGMSYRESARRAGYHEDHGFRLMQVDAIRDRVEELTDRPTERILAGINAEFHVLRNASNGNLDANGRANLRLQSKLLMAHARFSIAPKRQGAGGALSVEDERAWVTQRLEELEPGASRQIAERARAAEERSNRRRARGSARADTRAKNP